jgi:hypothetical protein
VSRSSDELSGGALPRERFSPLAHKLTLDAGRLLDLWVRVLARSIEGRCCQSRYGRGSAALAKTGSGILHARHAQIARRASLSRPLALPCRANHNDAFARLVPTRGAARDRHRRRARDAMAVHRRARSCARRAACVRTAKSRGPGAPMQALNS